MRLSLPRVPASSAALVGGSDRPRGAQVFDGTEAERVGLVLEATAPEKVQARALSLAHSVAAASPVAVRSCVKSLR